jgi:amino acid permease
MMTVITCLIPNFTDFINISGALGGGMIAFVLPCVFYNIEFKDTITLKRKWFNYFVIVVGVVGSGLSLYTSINSIIEGKTNE